MLRGLVRGFRWALGAMVLLTLVLIIIGSQVEPDIAMAATDGVATQAAPVEAPFLSGDGSQAAKANSYEELKRADADDVGGRLVSLLGIFGFIIIAMLFSTNRRAINWRLVAIGIGLQMAFALFILWTPVGEQLFGFLNDVVTRLLDFTLEGTRFLLADLVSERFTVAFNVLPTIIFFSSLMTVLYHIGAMQVVVRWLSAIMVRLMGTSGAETLSATANIFVGQTEAPLVVKPYVDEMTRSELMVVMTGGFATVAGGVLAAYVGLLVNDFPDIAGHLIAASVMSAPAALVIAKIMVPETEQPKTMGMTEFVDDDEQLDANAIDAAARGAGEGLKLAANVAAMLLAFIALIAVANFLFGLPSYLHNKAQFKQVSNHLESMTLPLAKGCGPSDEFEGEVSEECLAHSRQRFVTLKQTLLANTSLLPASCQSPASAELTTCQEHRTLLVPKTEALNCRASVQNMSLAELHACTQVVAQKIDAASNCSDPQNAGDMLRCTHHKMLLIATLRELTVPDAYKTLKNRLEEDAQTIEELGQALAAELPHAAENSRTFAACRQGRVAACGAVLSITQSDRWAPRFEAPDFWPAISLEYILGWIFFPIAFLMGIPWEDCQLVGQLLGQKIVLNEFIAYLNLSELVAEGRLRYRSIVICTYALCGFANLGSIAIQIGGIGGIAPSRRHDLARLGIRAMIGGSIAAFMTATIAGALIR